MTQMESKPDLVRELDHLGEGRADAGIAAGPGERADLEADLHARSLSAWQGRDE